MKRIFSIVIALITVSALFTLALPVSAKSVHKSTVSLIGINKNQSGSGYEWDNYHNVLTLDGLNVKTSDDYGLKIPDENDYTPTTSSINATTTVVLKGDNYIEAKKAAIFIEGKVVFKGSGTLTLVSETGIFCSSSDKTDSLSIIGGNYKITAKGIGIVSDFHRVSFSNCNVTVKTSSDIAIKAQTVTTGAKTVLTANGSISGKDKIQIESSSVTVNAKNAALISDKLVFTSVTVKAGDSASNLTDIDIKNSSYNGQKSVKIISNYDGQKKSVFFGDDVPRYVDIIVIILGVGIIACAIALPILRKKKKVKEAIAKRDAEQAQSKKKKN
ncbi:MAG: carbohydrate-binding domain-containing protein [Clostridia bacterium]|nr:carbohydrate-binding domain-containing protein [Clostridia bacterium]